MCIDGLQMQRKPEIYRVLRWIRNQTSRLRWIRNQLKKKKEKGKLHENAYFYRYFQRFLMETLVHHFLTKPLC